MTAENIPALTKQTYHCLLCRNKGSSFKGLNSEAQMTITELCSQRLILELLLKQMRMMCKRKETLWSSYCTMVIVFELSKYGSTFILAASPMSLSLLV